MIPKIKTSNTRLRLYFHEFISMLVIPTIALVTEIAIDGAFRVKDEKLLKSSEALLYRAIIASDNFSYFLYYLN